ncbi:MAG: SMC-Scp complex subunit ScpB [Gemmatimonadetes bacterium]|nr:SMC-Scp complex subunit ScpB [Gemmatimonadota bacterium]
MNPHQIVEAVLFASDAPITADEIARADERLDEDQVEQAIRQLQAEYDDAERSFEIVEVAEGYQVLTRPEFAPYLERFDNVPRPSRLSGPALETLSIIAYRQPLGRLEIEYIRGVGAQGVLKTLLDREMIEVVGRAEGLGRPVLYGTSSKFLEHFGLRSLEDLPRPEELPIVLRERIPLGPEEAGGAEGEGGDDAAPGPDQLTLGEGDGRAGPETGLPSEESAASADDAEDPAPAAGDPDLRPPATGSEASEDQSGEASDSQGSRGELR